MRLVAIFLVVPFAALYAADAEKLPSKASPILPACSTTLKDGRSLLTGGGPLDGPRASAYFFESDGTVKAVSPMLSVRAGQMCVGLRDGSVLVMGGSTGIAGPTNSAEIYRPQRDSWTTSGALVSPRVNGAAVLLNANTILVSGGETFGQVADSLELYDVSTGTSRLVHASSSPRANHSLAVLPDGRVVIAGGTSGKRFLDSIDIFDPGSEQITPGGLMTTPRTEFTATVLSDGRVLFAGGFDGQTELRTTELYDPNTSKSSPGPSLSAPRRRHIAVSPEGGANVLIAGGTARGHEVAQADLYLFTEGRIIAAPESTVTDAARRVHVTVGALDAAAQPQNVKVYLTEPQKQQ